MKLLLSLVISSMLTIASFAADALEVIEKEGVLRFSDGSSIYALHKDGRFELTPEGMSGRTISGVWKSDDGLIRIEGVWSWMNGYSIPDDMRIMRLQVIPRGEKEKVGLRSELVTKVYFTIESIQKKKGA